MLVKLKKLIRGNSKSHINRNFQRGIMKKSRLKVALSGDLNFKFLPLLFGHAGKRLDQKDKVTKSQPGKQQLQYTHCPIRQLNSFS